MPVAFAGTLWAIKDTDDKPQLVFNTSAPLAALSIYDVSFSKGRKHDRSDKQHHPWQRRRQGKVRSLGKDGALMLIRESQSAGKRNRQVWENQVRHEGKISGRNLVPRKNQVRHAGKISGRNPLPWKNQVRYAGKIDGRNPLQRHSIPSHRSEVLWAATSQRIRGYKLKDGSVAYDIDVCKDVMQVRGADQCCLTSRLMVAHSDDDVHERLVFAVSVTTAGHTSPSTNTDSTTGTEEELPSGISFDPAKKLTATFQGTKLSKSKPPTVKTQSTPYVIALNVGQAGTVQELWRVAGKSGTEIVGQIANVVYMPGAATKAATPIKRAPGMPSSKTFKKVLGKPLFKAHEKDLFMPSSKAHKNALQSFPLSPRLKDSVVEKMSFANILQGVYNDDRAISRSPGAMQYERGGPDDTSYDVKIVLVASAVSSAEQITLAIGHL